MKAGSTPATIDESIALHPPDIQAILQNIRATVTRAVPKAQERISYRMPALAPYAGPKGNLQFPLTERIPYALIGRIAKVRAKENAARAAARKKK